MNWIAVVHRTIGVFSTMLQMELELKIVLVKMYSSTEYYIFDTIFCGFSSISLIAPTIRISSNMQ